MLNRKTSSFIGHFYETNKGALLLIGARQIGKTSSIRQFGKNTSGVLLSDDAINYGAIYENVVVQELHAPGFEDQYYYNRKKLGGVDMVIEKNGNVFPINVKSCKDYARHRALNNIMMHPEFTISEAVVLCNDNLYVENSVTYALYMMFIHKEKPTNVMFSSDLSELQ